MGTFKSLQKEAACSMNSLHRYFLWASITLALRDVIQHAKLKDGTHEEPRLMTRFTNMMRSKLFCTNTADTWKEFVHQLTACASAVKIMAISKKRVWPVCIAKVVARPLMFASIVAKKGVLRLIHRRMFVSEMLLCYIRTTCNGYGLHICK